MVRIAEKKIREYWETPVEGADAFAVERNHVLVHGGYEDRDAWHLLVLEKGEARCVARFELRDTKGQRIEAQRVASKDDALFVLRGRDVFRIRVADARERFERQWRAISRTRRAMRTAGWQGPLLQRTPRRGEMKSAV